MRAGTCCFCGCSDFNPCPGGCGWSSREQTLCTECRDIQRAFVREARKVGSERHLAGMRRSFFRGYTAGADDERAIDFGLANTNSRGERPLPPNPYEGSDRARWWKLGFTLGEKWKSSHAA